MKKEFAALTLIVLSAAVFYYLVVAELNAILKTVTVIALLVACSFSLQKLLNIEGEYGLLLIRTKKGLKFIDGLAQGSPGVWNFLADIGLVLGFGFSSMLIAKRGLSAATVALGMLFLIILYNFILPFAAPLIVEMINLPGSMQSMGLTGEVAAQAAGGDSTASIVFALLAAAMMLSVVLGGVAAAGAFAILLKAFTILLAIVLFIFSAIYGVSDPGILATEGPGAAPVLPGINLPFIEGVLALAVLLVVHEGAHGVLGRVGKIPLKSAGVVFLGILPFGAFVDPDEKKLQKADVDVQNRVLVAGSASNLFTAALFFSMFLAFSYAVLAVFPTQDLGKTYVEVTNVASNGTANGFLEPGMLITGWRGTPVGSIQDFSVAANGTKEGDTVEVVTDKGVFTLTAGKGGKVGVTAAQYAYTFSNYVRDLSKQLPPLQFIYNFLGIAFVLNILVGIVNLLPIPPFDGYRILALKIGERKFWKIKVMDAIVSVIVAAFLANLLPWLWI